MHEVDPVTAIDVPTAQEVQAAVDVTALYVPAAQFMHTLLLEGYCPGPQADRVAQTVLDQPEHGELTYDPAEHVAQELHAVSTDDVHAPTVYFPVEHTVHVLQAIPSS